MYVHGHILGRGGGGGGGGREWKHLILLDQEALNHAGSSWKDPEGAGPGRLDSGRLSMPEPWTLADTKLVASGVLTSPLAEAGHAFPLLTRLARCRRFPVLGSVFSLG